MLEVHRSNLTRGIVLRRAVRRSLVLAFQLRHKALNTTTPYVTLTPNFHESRSGSASFEGESAGEGGGEGVPYGFRNSGVGRQLAKVQLPTGATEHAAATGRCS